MEVEIKENHIADAKNACEQAVIAALHAMGIQCAEYAADNAPVDTSRLKNSIHHQMGEGCVYVGTNVEYAKYVEFIDRYHHNTGQAHFLRDAVTQHIDEYRQIAEKYLKGMG